MGHLVNLKQNLIQNYCNFIKSLSLLNKKFLDHPQDDRETVYDVLAIIY